MANPDAIAGIPRHRRPIAVVAVLSAMALVVLDAGMANVALPNIAKALAVTPASAVLVITSYQAALVMALLPCSALGQRLGYRRVFVAGVTLFTAASVLCSLALTLPLLLAARFLQGLGGAAVMALGVALLRFTVPHDQLGRVISWNALTVALSTAVAPTVGALILSHASWPSLFVINFPVGCVALVASQLLPSTRPSSQPLDVPSMALTSLMFGAMVLGAEFAIERPVLGWATIAVASMSLLALVRRERPKVAPLIPIDLLRSKSFRTSVIASVICFTGQTAGVVALPFYLQYGLQQSTLATGLYMTAWPLSVAATATVSGRLADRLPAAWLCAGGATLLAIGLAIAALWPLKGNPAPLVLFAAICGVGFGLFNVPNNRTMFLTAPPERSAAAGGMQGTARLTGQTAGAVLMTALFTLTTLNFAPRIGLIVGALFALIAAMVSISHRAIDG
ncbi:MAG: MFS transporter [Sphingomonadales bacterium]|nr:MFS transporter [Sphingomonadales bacterium]